MIIKLCRNNNYKKESVKRHEGWGGRGLAQYLEQTVSWEKLGTVIYIGMYVYVCSMYILIASPGHSPL